MEIFKCESKVLVFQHCAERYSVGGGLIKKAADAFVLVLKKQIAKKMSMEFIMRESRNCKSSSCEEREQKYHFLLKKENW